MVLIGEILVVMGAYNLYIKRDNYLIVLVSLELILLGLALTSIAISQILGDSVGYVLAIYIIVIGATESAIGLTILLQHKREVSRF